MLAQRAVAVPERASVFAATALLFATGAELLVAGLGQSVRRERGEAQTSRGSYQGWPTAAEVRALRARGRRLMRFADLAHRAPRSFFQVIGEHEPLRALLPSSALRRPSCRALPAALHWLRSIGVTFGSARRPWCCPRGIWTATDSCFPTAPWASRASRGPTAMTCGRRRRPWRGQRARQTARGLVRVQRHPRGVSARRCATATVPPPACTQAPASPRPTGPTLTGTTPRAAPSPM